MMIPDTFVRSCLWFACVVACSARVHGAEPPASTGPKADANVIFADDFESWEAEGTRPPEGTASSCGWSVRQNKISRTRVVPGKVTVDGSSGAGRSVLQIACWTEGSGSQSGGLSLKLGNYNHRNEGLGDGIEELWIDGQLTIRKEGVRFRRAADLRITFFSLETYYHGLPKNYDRAHPIRVYFDNVVIARKYIGP